MAVLSLFWCRTRPFPVLALGRLSSGFWDEGGELCVCGWWPLRFFPISGERLIACSVGVLRLSAVRSVRFGLVLLPRLASC